MLMHQAEAIKEALCPIVGSGLLAELSVFAGVSQVQQRDSRFDYLAAHIVMTNMDSAYIPRFKFFKSLTNARIGQQRGRCGGKLLHCSCGGRLIHRGQTLV